MYQILPINFKRIFLLISCCFASSLSFAQAPSIQWDKTIGANKTDRLGNIIQLIDGSYVLFGSSDSDISGDKSGLCKGNTDFWLVKTDSSGSKIWDRTIGSNLKDAVTTAEKTSDGGYILGCWTMAGISGDKTGTNKGFDDYWIIKIDSNGYKVWDKSFGGSGDEFLRSVRQTPDGGYILGGQSGSQVSGDKTSPAKAPGASQDFWILKLDSLGNKIWDKTIGTVGGDHYSTLTLTQDGGIILGGFNNSEISADKTQANKGNNDYWIVKLNSSGNILWDKSFGGYGHDYLSEIVEMRDGNIILAGSSTSNISFDKTESNKGIFNSLDYWILKLDSSGNKIWDKTIGGGNNEAISSIVETADEGFILGGYSVSGASADKSESNWGPVSTSDYWIVKLNKFGVKIWDKTLGGTDSEYLTDIIETTDRRLVIGGYSGSGITGNKTENIKGLEDFWIVKLGPDQINNISEPTSPTQHKIFPNPITSNFTLQLTTNLLATATLTNNLGQQIETRNITPQNGQITEQFSTQHLAKGIYYLSVTTGQSRTVKKIVVQ